MQLRNKTRLGQGGVVDELEKWAWAEATSSHICQDNGHRAKSVRRMTDENINTATELVALRTLEVDLYERWPVSIVD